MLTLPTGARLHATGLFCEADPRATFSPADFADRVAWHGYPAILNEANAEPTNDTLTAATVRAYLVGDPDVTEGEIVRLWLALERLEAKASERSKSMHRLHLAAAHTSPTTDAAEAA